MGRCRRCRRRRGKGRRRGRRYSRRRRRRRCAHGPQSRGRRILLRGFLRRRPWGGDEDSLWDNHGAVCLSGVCRCCRLGRGALLGAATLWWRWAHRGIRRRRTLRLVFGLYEVLWRRRDAAPDLRLVLSLGGDSGRRAARRRERDGLRCDAAVGVDAQPHGARAVRAAYRCLHRKHARRRLGNPRNPGESAVWDHAWQHAWQHAWSRRRGRDGGREWQQGFRLGPWRRHSSLGPSSGHTRHDS